MADRLFSCSSIEDIDIPDSGSSDFFKPEEGNTKIRFIAGPIIFFESQAFDKEKKPVGDKKFYPYPSENAKKDKHAKLVFQYFIYDYREEKIKQWNIGTRNLQKTIQTLNSLNPDLSLMDCVLNKTKGSNGFNEYKLVSGQIKEFENKEIIKEFVENDTLNKAYEYLEEKIAETITQISINDSNAEFEKEVKTTEVNQQEVEDIFDEGKKSQKDPFEA